MDQKTLRRKLKIAKLDNDFFDYQDISELLNIRIGSLYNWLNGSFQLSQKKAKILENWLEDFCVQET